jgi:hypothetical protein
VCENVDKKEGISVPEPELQRESHTMTLESEKILDETGWRLLQELQQNACLSYKDSR